MGEGGQVTKKQPARTGRRAIPDRRLRETVVPLDAEDIAMDRLQAHLRKTEAIRLPNRRGAPTLVRTTVRLRREMLQQVKDRARREGATISEVLEVALERYLKSP